MTAGNTVQRMWRRHDVRKPSYDVVIIGGGVHGLAVAYYLAKNHGVTDVAVLDKSYLGSGASGRNTAILRANYRTPEGVAFYNTALELYERLSSELEYNLLFSQHGHLTLAHTDRGIQGLRERAEVNRLLGVDSRLIGPDEIAELVPGINVRRDARHPILAGLYHPPGGIIRHDAVVWGYARGADRLGVQIHPKTEVTGIKRAGGRVSGVVTTRGEIAAGTVVNATAGWAGTIAAMVDLRLPIVTHPLQALVTEPLKPFLNVVIVSATLHVYVNQTDRGELVIGSEIDPYSTYSMRSTLPFLEHTAAHTLELFPCLARVNVLRQWAGLCDMTPDFAPILGEAPECPGFILDIGWGTYGFKAAPAAGSTIAELIATGETPALIEPFRPTRFLERDLLGEKAAAAVSH
jgi:sarcosine oxidase subunit beta